MSAEHLSGTTALSFGAALTSERLREAMGLVEELTTHVDLYASDIIDRPMQISEQVIQRPGHIHPNAAWISLIVPRAQCDRWIAALSHPMVVMRLFGFEKKEKA